MLVKFTPKCIMCMNLFFLLINICKMKEPGAKRQKLSGLVIIVGLIENRLVIAKQEQLIK